MVDILKHECGVAFLRQRKAQSYYQEKYQTSDYGLQKISIMLAKQHNRGQDGAGIVSLKLESEQGEPYYNLKKFNNDNPLAQLMLEISKMDGNADVFLGHLRYSTFGNIDINACHPVLKPSNCKNRTLLLAGNFNLTNIGAIFDSLVASGHQLTNRQDSLLMNCLFSHNLEQIFRNNTQTRSITKDEIFEFVKNTVKEFDGGFCISGVLGTGDAFVVRDSNGIRPCYYHISNELVAVASERPAIQTALNLRYDEVIELPLGAMLIIDREGNTEIRQVLEPKEPRRCVFERIYFSRGNDYDIHRERRELGSMLTPAILKAIDYDIKNSVFSYIPNTAEISFHGLLDSLYQGCYPERIRFSQIAVKDAKFRTFISEDVKRKTNQSMHVYDITYGVIKRNQDNLIVLDDSIVRGNTLKNSILKILDRLEPKLIVVASSAPPICYPDCYGIDIGSFTELIAFESAVNLLKKKNRLYILDECVKNAYADLKKNDEEMVNNCKPIYEASTFEELCDEIALALTPKDLKAKVKVVFQTNENLRKCCPNHTGDWYFTGNYPTAGGNRVVNQALINYIEKQNKRAY